MFECHNHLNDPNFVFVGRPFFCLIFFVIVSFCSHSILCGTLFGRFLIYRFMAGQFIWLKHRKSVAAWQQAVCCVLRAVCWCLRFVVPAVIVILVSVIKWFLLCAEERNKTLNKALIFPILHLQPPPSHERARARANFQLLNRISFSNHFDFNKRKKSYNNKRKTLFSSFSYDLL